MNFNELRFEVLSAEHGIQGFTCGNGDMDDYLKQEALSEQDDLQATTTVVLYQGEVVAYFTLATDVLVEGDMDKHMRQPLEEDPYMEWPALIIHRLAIRSNYQGRKDSEGQSFCGYLLAYIFGLAYHELARLFAGCRFVLLNAYRDKVSMYQHFEFVKNERYEGTIVSMRYDLKRFAKLFAEAASQE